MSTNSIIPSFDTAPSVVPSFYDDGIASGGAGGYTTIQKDGVAQPQEPFLDFTGSFAVGDDPGGTRTLVSIKAGGITNAMLVNSSLTITAGTGLATGGSVSLGSAVTLDLANTAVTPGAYTILSATIDQQGRITAASNGTVATSVSNSDGTLTISPTTGAVVASLALAKANTWTGAQTFNTAVTTFGFGAAATGAQNFDLSGGSGTFLSNAGGASLAGTVNFTATSGMAALARTYSPSSAVNNNRWYSQSTFSPSASSPSYAEMHLNPTFNGTSSGKAYGLIVASKTNTLTGGTMRAISSGTTTTDGFTGYTEKFYVDTAGNVFSGGTDVYFNSANTHIQGSATTLDFIVGTVGIARMIGSGTPALKPLANGTIDLGNSGLAWREFWARRHYGSGTAPSVTAGTGAGTGPTVSVTGTDASGLITVTTGTLPAGTSANIVTLNFNAAYAAAPNGVIITPAEANSAAIGGATGVFVDNAQTTTAHFILVSGVTGLTAATTYKWYYIVMG